MNDTIWTSSATDEMVDRKLSAALDERSLATLFVEARTANAFVDHPVPHALLDRALELALLGPTSANCLPLRLIFVESPEAKAKLEPALSDRNRDKTMAAPITAIVATDLQFYEHFPRLFPERAEMFGGMFRAMPEPAQRATAWDNALLQMGYFIIALRSIGLDAGPMAGFERGVVDDAFFSDGRFASQYLINIGFGDYTHAPPRLPRFDVDDIASYA